MKLIEERYVELQDALARKWHCRGLGKSGAPNHCASHNIGALSTWQNPTELWKITTTGGVFASIGLLWANGVNCAS
ncbi:MAG: hypothetical protein ACRERV_05205 [Methylococcales bacterium]